MPWGWQSTGQCGNDLASLWAAQSKHCQRCASDHPSRRMNCCSHGSRESACPLSGASNGLHAHRPPDAPEALGRHLMLFRFYTKFPLDRSQCRVPPHSGPGIPLNSRENSSGRVLWRVPSYSRAVSQSLWRHMTLAHGRPACDCSTQTHALRNTAPDHPADGGFSLQISNKNLGGRVGETQQPSLGLTGRRRSARIIRDKTVFDRNAPCRNSPCTPPLAISPSQKMKAPSWRWIGGGVETRSPLRCWWRPARNSRPILTEIWCSSRCRWPHMARSIVSAFGRRCAEFRQGRRTPMPNLLQSLGDRRVLLALRCRPTRSPF